MKSIVITAGQSRLIPILLEGRSPVLSFPPASQRGERKRESGDWIPNQVGNDENGNKRLEVVLAGENASVEVIGLVLPARSYFDASGSIRTRVKGRSLAGEGQADDRSLEVYITHAAPNTKSDVKVKAVLTGRSTFAFRGKVKIEKGAKGSDAYLRSDVLLFDQAKMGDDTPALEILEPDVKAGHAATIGKVDEQMLFYLMSRGLSRKQAEKMLVEGFISPILHKIRNTTERRMIYA